MSKKRVYECDCCKKIFESSLYGAYMTEYRLLPHFKSSIWIPDDYVKQKRKKKIYLCRNCVKNIFKGF